MSILLFLLFWSLSPASSKAEALTEAGIYYRCHAQFARARPAAADPLLRAVKTGELKGARACEQLLEGISLPGKVPEAKRAVFESFLAFHASWFPLRSFLVNGSEGASSAYFDSDEMAYHVNVALFGPGRFEEIVTGNRSFVARRKSDRQPAFFADPDFRGQFRKLTDSPWPIEGGKPWNPKKIEHGRIEAILVRETGVPSPVKSKLGELSLSGGGTFGSGLLGTDTYLLLNSNQAAFDPSDNANLSHRRWGKSVMRDLLCRELPAIRATDAAPFVDKNSNVPFRQHAECMRCHATMDPLADGARDIMELRPDGAMRFDFEPRMLGKFRSDRAPLLSANQDMEFHRRPPWGRLYYRNSRGELVDRKFTGLGALGPEIAQMEDFYTCAAKRYFQFMTGIDVKMADFSEIPLSPADQPLARYRKFVLELGEELKAHQSLKKLVSSILHSKYYAQIDYGVTE